MADFILKLEHDQDVETPDSGYDGWKLISFGRRHINYEDPDTYIARANRNEGIVVKNPGLRTKLRVGLAFFLSYYEHGEGAWSIIGEGTQDRWDTAYLAGLLVWTGKPGDIGAKTLEDRAKDARSFLNEYNEWANGHTYYFVLETPEGENVESLGGFIGLDHVGDGLSDFVKAGDRLKADGDLESLVQYIKLPDGVTLVDDFDEEAA